MRTFVKTISGVLVLVAALTACDQVKAGAAATFDDGRITETQVNTASRDWEKAFGKLDGSMRERLAPQRQVSGCNPEATQCYALIQMIRFRVLDEAAQQAGITATQGQIDAFVARAAQGTDPQRLLTRVALASGLPTRYAKDVARAEFQRVSLLQQTGQQNLPQAQQQLNVLLGQTAEKMNVQVNPRYGTFKPEQLTIDAPKPLLSEPETGT